MDIIVYLDGKASYKLPIRKSDTIRDIKGYLQDYLGENLQNSKDSIRFYLNSKEELLVFDSDEYDALKLEEVWSKLISPKIYIKKNKPTEIINSQKPDNSQRLTELSGIKDVDLKIINNLSYTDLLNVERTSKYMKKLLTDKYFWLNRLEKDFPLRSKYIYYKEYLDLKRNNPRKLYEIINSQSKIINLSKYIKGSDYKFLRKDFEDYHDDDKMISSAKKITQAVQIYLSELPLLRGDIIVIGNNNWTNLGKLIWDGEKAVPLNFLNSKDGYIPKELSFPEFPLNHFTDATRISIPTSPRGVRVFPPLRR